MHNVVITIIVIQVIVTITVYLVVVKSINYL
jgi:hypothetical protein